jgi:excisionase family DNA binding protein
MPLVTNRKTDKPRTFLTVKDLAELDSCSEKTVRRAIAIGVLEAVRVGPGGRLLRIDPVAHAAYRKASRW